MASLQAETSSVGPQYMQARVEELLAVRRQDRQKHGLSVYTFDQAWSELQFLMRTLLLLRRVFESVEVVRLQNFLSWRMESAMYLLARAQDEQGKVSYDSLPILMSEDPTLHATHGLDEHEFSSYVLLAFLHGELSVTQPGMPSSTAAPLSREQALFLKSLPRREQHQAVGGGSGVAEAITASAALDMFMYLDVEGRGLISRAALERSLQGGDTAAAATPPLHAEDVVAFMTPQRMSALHWDSSGHVDFRGFLCALSQWTGANETECDSDVSENCGDFETPRGEASGCVCF